jgi:hypothetical protein
MIELPPGDTTRKISFGSKFVDRLASIPDRAMTVILVVALILGILTLIEAPWLP